MSINFIDEFLAFMIVARRYNLPATARLLWITLFYLSNDRAEYHQKTNQYKWPTTFFPITNDEIKTNSLLSKRDILSGRDILKSYKLIDFIPGANDKIAAKYKLIYLTAKKNKKKAPTVPASAPAKKLNTKSAHASATVPISIDTEHGIEKKGCKRTPSDISSINARAREDRGGSRLHDEYLDASNEPKPCRFDSAFLTSDKARNAVAQRILDGFRGEYDYDDAHSVICEYMSCGMEPEIFDDDIMSYDTLSEYMSAMGKIFRDRRYEEKRDALEWNRCLRIARGNLALARSCYNAAKRLNNDIEQ